MSVGRKFSELMLTEQRTLLMWLLSEHTGVSSKNIVRQYVGLPITDWSGWPKDSADFGRCQLLLEACPFIDITIMKTVNKVWRDLVSELMWPGLAEALKSGDHRGVSAIIRGIEMRYFEGPTLHKSAIELEE